MLAPSSGSFLNVRLRQSNPHADVRPIDEVSSFLAGRPRSDVS
jgi:hypothetical protein